MKSNLIWVAYDMLRDYYISLLDGQIYRAEMPGINIPFRPEVCEEMPDHVSYITYPIRNKQS